MKRIVLVALFFPFLSFADDPFSCVSPEIRQAFLPGYPDATEYSTELPNGFIEHSVPHSSTLVGSQVNSSYASVVYAVDDDVDSAIDGIANSIVESGWSDLGDSPGMPRGGFQTAASHRYRQMCHDDGPRILTVSAKNTESAGLVSLTINSGMGVASCDELSDRNRYSYRHMSLANELPKLSLPDNVRSNNQGSGGGGDEYDTRATVSTDVSRESLAALLNDQIRDQGWSFDASWSGSQSVGSTWTKESADGKPLVGMLHAYGGSGNAYNLQFSIRLDNARGSAGRNSFGVRLQ